MQGRTVSVAGRMMMLAAALMLWVRPSASQSTEIAITGTVTNARTEEPVFPGRVLYRNQQTSVSGVAETDEHGFYALPSLPPGVYTIRAEGAGYQARELQAKEIYVSARLELNFDLRRLGEINEPGGYNSTRVADNETVLPTLGPDLELGRSEPIDATDVQSEVRQPSLSYTIDPRQIARAPLSTRNVYALLVTLPGVTGAQITGRGLQISANGQRASASNYLLDGVQNNDFVNTGPFAPTAPEAIQEYRASTGNYSAEYGQTGGFVANAVTNRGGNAYHGETYGYLDNEALDANTSLNNAGYYTRNSFKRLYAGYAAGGPILKERLFFASSLEQLRSRSNRNPIAINYLVPSRIRQCLGGASSPILELYNRFPLRDPNMANSLLADYPCDDFGISVIEKPVSLDRTQAVERLDYQSLDGAHRLMGRIAISRAKQPDYQYSIYRDLSQAIVRNSTGLAIGYIRSFGPRLVSDLRAAWNPGKIDATRPHPEVPVLQVLLNSEQTFEVPSARQDLDFGMKGSQAEINEGLTWTHGVHVVTAGGGVLLRRPRYLIGYLDQGLYYFGAWSYPFCFITCTEGSLRDYAAGKASYYELPFSRVDAAQGKYVPAAPRTYDQYSNNQFSVYLQDNLRLTRRLVMNVGVRYESYGSLRNDSRAQTFLEPGTGQWIQDRLATAQLAVEKRSPYRPDRNNWEGRFGISYNPWNETVLRVGYGVFHDRPFDNLFLDARNTAAIAAMKLGTTIDLSKSPRDLFAGGLQAPIPPDNQNPSKAGFFITNNLCCVYYENQYQGFQTLDSRVVHSTSPELLWVDRNLRTPYVQSWFASVQRQVWRQLQVEVNHTGTLGRKLISTDLVNRLICVSSCGNTTPSAVTTRLNPALPDIIYRSNSGSSNYLALEALARYRTARGMFQASYTYSHSIDNISDPMLSDAFNLAATNPDTIGAAHSFGMFTRQFDSRADRGNSDFDIRQNLTLYSVWDLPAPGRSKWMRAVGSWTAAGMASIRSGLPYTIFSPQVSLPVNQAVLVGARADVKDLAALHSSFPVTAGKALVSVANGLAQPPAGGIGTLGRNALGGPGFWNVDLSLTRSFAFAPLGESGRIQFGAGAFNAFNHSNLGFPDIYTGVALYGPSQNQTQFPAALPQFPTPRRIQLQLKLMF